MITQQSTRLSPVPQKWVFKAMDERMTKLHPIIFAWRKLNSKGRQMDRCKVMHKSSPCVRTGRLKKAWFCGTLLSYGTWCDNGSISMEGNPWFYQINTTMKICSTITSQKGLANHCTLWETHTLSELRKKCQLFLSSSCHYWFICQITS